MADRTVSVTLRAKVNAFKADMGAAGKAARDAAQQTETAWDKSNSRMGNAMKQVSRYEAELTSVGTAMAGFGAVVVGALGLATKASMSWESAWTGVLKTVEGSPKQLAAVEAGLRGLAKELPATHEEIAAVAEAAGQLGISTGNVVSFTRTMINMGESTNLSAEEAATGLARLSNIMGTSQNDFSKMGASIVGLGNNFATTEKEILEMSSRIAGVGAQAGLSEGDVFGLATALSSVGIEAEAGGTAVSLVMKKIGNEVANGGDKLETFARVAGMSSSEFAAAWNEDAGGALDMFVQGLGRAQSEGENVNGTLSELGITGIRESDALLRLAASGDVLTSALKTGNDEYARGTALAEEAAKRYQTAESRIKIAGNSLKDTAITIGGTFLPAMAEAADAVAGFSTTIGKIPEPVLRLGAALGGVVGSVALVGGGFLLLAPRIAETITAVNTLRGSSTTLDKTFSKLGGNGKTGRALRGIGKAAGLAAGAFVGLQVAAATYNSISTEPAVKGVEDITGALIAAAEQAPVTGMNLDKVFQGEDGEDLAGNINGIGDAIDQVMYKGDGFNKWINENLGGDAINEMLGTTGAAADQFVELDESIANLVNSGSTELAAESFASIAAAFEEQGYSAEQALKFFPELEAAYRGIANEAGVSLEKQELLNWMMTGEMPAAVAVAVESGEIAAGAIEGVGGAADDASRGLQGMLEDLLALGIIQQTEMEAMAGYEEAIDGISAAVEENGRTLDITTEAGRNNQAALFLVADRGREVADSMAAAGASQGELQEHMKRTYDDLVAGAKQFGATGDEADAMARKVLGIPDGVSIETWMSDEAAKDAIDLKKILEDLDNTTVNTYVKVNETYIRKNQGEATYTRNRHGNAPRARAAGGIDLRPMAAGGVLSVAEMVPPNTWRLVGDRMDVDEAFIPLDGSPRSMAILMEAIKRMPGFGGAMADGGVTGGGGVTGSSGGESGEVGGIPVPDTAPITEAWQAMFDAMLTTTLEGWAAQVAQQVLSHETLLLGTQTHLAAQVALLQADYATQNAMRAQHNASEAGVTQTHYASMLSLAQGQWAAMNASVLAAMQLQNQNVTSGFEAQHSIMGQILSAMGGTLSNRWSDMFSYQSSYLGSMQSNASSGFNAIRSGGESQMSALSSAVAREMGELPPETRSAMQDTATVLNKFADAVNEAFGEIGVTVPNIPAFAEGGPISGPGTGTSDSILARVSNGEFIMPAAKTAQYYPMLEQMRSGSFPGYAAGGMVDLKNAASWLQNQGVRITEFGAWGQPVGGHSNGSYHYRAPGQAFDANAGPGGQNATEMAIFDRLVPMVNSMWPSLRTLWRVAGHFNHLHVDTGGNGAASGAMGGLLGAIGGAMPADMGDAYAQAAKKVGGDLVSKFSGDLPDNPMASGLGSGIMSQAVEGLTKMARDFGDSFMEGSGEAGGVERWRSTVMAALQRVGLPVNDAYIEAWLRQIMSESGGNPGVTQGVQDVNSGGNEAVGLVQVIPGTFASFRDPDLPNDRRNPLANLVAGMNWANYKYGRDHLDVIGHGHGYANGTMSAQRGWAMVGEEGPEMMWLNGGEKIANASTTRSMLGNNRMYHDNATSGMNANAIGAAFAREARKQGVNSADMANALDGVKLTLMVGNEPMEAFVHSSVSAGYSASRSRISRSSQKTGAI